MTFSDRSDVAREANPVTRALAAARARGRVLDLTVSNPAAAGLPYDRAAIASALAEVDPTDYRPSSLGDRRAREALCRLGLAASVDDVLLTASTSEAYAYLFRLLADRGDEVLVPAPSYPLLADLAHATDVHLRSYALRWDGAWHAPAGELYDAIGERTRAIVVVSPNNPTGHFLARDEAEALGALGVPLILDEVFGAYAHDGEPAPLPAAEGLRFRLDGLSKRAALPGLKLAWTRIEGPRAARDEARARLELMADTFLSPSLPPQLALAPVLDASEVTRRAILDRAKQNLAQVARALEGTAASAPSVAGGWYAPVRVPSTRSDEGWCLALLERGVYAHPGYFYDFDPDQAWLVLSLLTPPEDLRAGLDALVRLVADPDPPTANEV